MVVDKKRCCGQGQIARDSMYAILWQLLACMYVLLQEMTEKFGEDLKKAAAGGLADWQAGFNALAAVILMDQMSR